MDSVLLLLILVVVLALVFDYINGFHDTANAVATVVSTNVLPGRTAVLLAAVLNVVGALMGVKVAETIGRGITDPAEITQTVVLAALVGAILWNLLTWYYGIPSSSSHALIGGIVGAVWCHKVVDASPALPALWDLITAPGVLLALKALVFSPLLGLLAGFFLMILLLWIALRLRPVVVNKGSRVLQLASAASMAFAHGSNDAQKSMGIIAMALMAFAVAAKDPPRWVRPFLPAVSFQLNDKSFDSLRKEGVPEDVLAKLEPLRFHGQGPRFETAQALSAELAAALDEEERARFQDHIVSHARDLPVPLWVILGCAAAMGLGTASGGWRIMKTMGHKIIKLRPINGFAAESAAALVILTATHLGAPVSTTHVISASIMGVGASKRVSAVRWGVAQNILIAWVLTIPISALVAALTYGVLRAVIGG